MIGSHKVTLQTSGEPRDLALHGEGGLVVVSTNPMNTQNGLGPDEFRQNVHKSLSLAPGATVLFLLELSQEELLVSQLGI